MSEPGSDTSREIRVHVFGRTDVGQVREHNEDNFLVADLTRQTRGLMESERLQVVGERGTLLGVCDGMGGAAAGEVASQLAVDMIFEKLSTAPPPVDHDDLARRLVRAVEEAGVRIFNEARADRTRRGMGTTATIAALMDGRLFLAQVGDSRCYVLRNGKMVLVTRDQSLVNQLIEAGQLTEEEAETFEHNNIILQALGTAETVQVDLTYVDLYRGDTLVLCSDGLSGMVRGDDMREILAANTDPLEACRVLTERANSAGGHDNITVIVAHLDGPGLPEANQQVPLPGYQKYALPELPASEPLPPQERSPRDSPTWPPSDEMFSDPAQLKAGQSVLGVSVPPAVPPDSTHRLPQPLPSAPPPPSEREDDPVYIPTTGLAPAIIGFMVLGSLLLVAALGFFVLR
jgi:serine/threonine protein phosphatase PrpC